MTKAELQLQVNELKAELAKAKSNDLRNGQYTDPNSGITYANDEVRVLSSNPSDTGGRFVFTVSVNELKTFLDSVPDNNQVSISTRLYEKKPNAKAQRLNIRDTIFAGELSVSSKRFDK